MNESKTQYDTVDPIRATLAGSLLGATFGLSVFGQSVENRAALAFLVRETALCSTLSSAAAFVGSVLHNQITKHNWEEREKARAVPKKDAERTV